MALQRIDAYTCRYFDVRRALVHAVIQVHRTHCLNPKPLRAASRGQAVRLIDDARPLLAVPIRHRETREEQFVLLAFTDPRRAKATALAASTPNHLALAVPVSAITLIAHARKLHLPLAVILGPDGADAPHQEVIHWTAAAHL